MRKFLFLLTCVTATACADQAPTTAVAPSERPRENAYASSNLAQARTHWRSDTELLAYDMTPELGLVTFFHDGNLVTQNINQLKDARVRMFRVPFFWDDADPNGDGSGACGSYPKYGCYFYTQVDNINAAIDQGLVPVVVIAKEPNRFKLYPGPLTSTGAPTQPTDAQLQDTWYHFNRFMGDLVDALPRVRYWQILNEQDAGHHGVNMLGGYTQTWQNGQWRFDNVTQGRNYARLVQSTYNVVKSHNPDAWVVMGAVTGTPWMDPQGAPHSTPNWSFLHSFYQNGGRSGIDIMATHAYGHVSSADHTGLTGKGSAIRSVMSQYGDATAPLWLTEFGREAATYAKENPGAAPWSGTAFDEDQRRHWMAIIDAYPTLNQYQKVFGFSITQNGEGAAPANASLHAGLTPADYGLGIFRNDQTTPRLAYTAVQAHPINDAVRSTPYASGTLQVYAPGKYPVGYSYSHDGTYVQIYGVVINKLYPLKITFDYLPPPEECQPVFPAVSC